MSSLLGVWPQDVFLESNHVSFRLNEPENSSLLRDSIFISETLLHTHFCTSHLSGGEAAKIVTSAFQTIGSENLCWDIKEWKKKKEKKGQNTMETSVHCWFIDSSLNCASKNKLNFVT